MSGEAIDNMGRLAEFNPWWIEEPTSPDDVLGHAAIARAVAPIGVATGEHCQNRVIFKQLLQAKAITFCQIDSCRLGGVNEVLAVLLMAAKFGVPVCPHAGGVGLVRVRPAPFDLRLYRGQRLARKPRHRICRPPARAFLRPGDDAQRPLHAAEMPGYSITMKPESLDTYEFPNGPAWSETAMANVSSNGLDTTRI